MLERTWTLLAASLVLMTGAMSMTSADTVSVKGNDKCEHYIIEPVVVPDHFQTVWLDHEGRDFWVFLEARVASSDREGFLTGLVCSSTLEEILCEVGNHTIRVRCIEMDEVDIHVDPVTEYIWIDIGRYY